MRIGEQLRDPRAWLLAAAAGAVGWLLLAATSAVPTPALAGLGIAAVTLVGRVALGTPRRGAPVPARRDLLPEVPPDSRQAELVGRAAAALRHMADLAGRPADRRTAADLRAVLDGSAGVATSLRELAGRVTLLDTSIAAARPDALAHEIADLQGRMDATTDPGVRAEQERALAALDSQADAIDRLLGRRDTLLTQMQAAAVGLEVLAARCAEIVALGPADADGTTAPRIAELTEGLDAAQAGIDEARRVLGEL
jgi:hypothetical protein